MLPLWVLRRTKTFKNFYSIKGRICRYFSIEKINEIIQFKECLERKALKIKKSNYEINSELIKIKNNENICLNDGKNNNNQLYNNI